MSKQRLIDVQGGETINEERRQPFRLAGVGALDQSSRECWSLLSGRPRFHVIMSLVALSRCVRFQILLFLLGLSYSWIFTLPCRLGVARETLSWNKFGKCSRENYLFLKSLSIEIVQFATMMVFYSFKRKGMVFPLFLYSFSCCLLLLRA